MRNRNVKIEKKTILVTGAAGFIGANLVQKLFEIFDDVLIIGLDNLNDYYDRSLKEYRLNTICKSIKSNKCENGKKWQFIKGSIVDKKLIFDLFDKYKFDIVVNLAAQAGVRYSILNPDAYIETNIIGFYNLLEACKIMCNKIGNGLEHFVFASSSSVYGSNTKTPYSINDKVDNPVSLYAATKKSDELLAHAYSLLYGIPSTGLRFFTVYGPAGRPDMAYFDFTNKLIKKEKIRIFNYGNCIRDFTYIDDIVEGIIKVIQCAPEQTNALNGLPQAAFRIYNIGNNKPVNLLEFVELLQYELIQNGLLPSNYDFEAHRELVPMQPGDVPITYADISELEQDFGYRPSTMLHEGLHEFVKWYKLYYYK